MTTTSITTSSTTTSTTTTSTTPNGVAGGALTYVEIRPGEGGDDAVLFAEELARAISSYGARKGAVTERSGERTIVLAVKSTEEANFELFSGIHRIQRIPSNDKAGRRHSSTVSVAVLDGAVESFEEIPESDVREDFYRGHGKGGQHRNKTSSAVRLTHIPSGTVVVVERGRSQGQNLERAWAELRRRLALSHQEVVATSRNSARGRQIRTGERSMKQWTWNTQRSEVVNHESGQRWRLRDFMRGDVGEEC